MENNIDKPCAICAKLPANGKFWVDGEACEFYCNEHADMLKLFISDHPGNFHTVLRRQLP